MHVVGGADQKPRQRQQREAGRVRHHPLAVEHEPARDDGQVGREQDGCRVVTGADVTGHQVAQRAAAGRRNR